MLQIIINGIKLEVEVNKVDKNNRVVVFYESLEYDIANVLYFYNHSDLTHTALKHFIKEDLHSNNVKELASINKIEICAEKISSILESLESDEYNKVLERLEL